MSIYLPKVGNIQQSICHDLIAITNEMDFKVGQPNNMLTDDEINLYGANDINTAFLRLVRLMVSFQYQIIMCFLLVVICLSQIFKG